MAADGRLPGPTDEGFAALYERWWGFVKREAAFAGAREGAAEDIAQLIFARLWNSRNWHAIESPSAYFRAAAAREARRVHSLDAALPLGAVALVDPSPDPLEQAVASEACDTMVEALAALPPRCAEVMSRTVFELCSITEIAAALDISSGAVGKQRTRGWRKLRQWFDARGGAPVWLSTFQDVVERGGSLPPGK